MIHDSILETIGNTPLVRLKRIPASGSADVLAKVESFNPMSSIKDRIALAMVEDAERRGALRPGMIVVEPTSGNTGIGLAMVCASKGYKLLLTMPESMTVERRKLLKAMGADIILTPAPEGMGGAVCKAEEICKSDTNRYMPLQFDNPANPAVHERTTALEILKEIPEPDAFVAGIGTGGTVTGVGRAFKKKGLGTIIVGIEPAGSPIITEGKRGPHGIQGIGAGFGPKVLDMKAVDRMMTVKDADAMIAARRLAREEGILAGISSGAAVHAACLVAKELGPGKKVVVILPDTGERYLSTELFES
ncbi:MAG: cysteine synthase A [Methanomassiliicoccales archaeon]